MGIIRELPKELVEKIAAGEVVERPASVVKELVENAIDAGATSIVVEVVDGGKGRIAVIDDGCGMSSDDLGMCIRRHATSKIADEKDLWNIRTMGFRGEALAAIGAVSKMEIWSRKNEDGVIEGSKVEVTGGMQDGPVVAGCAGGTKIVVSDLFYNVPARLKFLRSSGVEFGHVSECMTSVALANPHIRFELIEGGRKKLSASKVGREANEGEIVSRLIAIMGNRYRDGFIHLLEEGDGISIDGWVSEDGRKAGKDMHIFLNGRPVRDRMLMHAVSSAIGDGTERDRYPAAVLWLSIDPAQVDVNVHPAKREVRFEKGGAVHDFVKFAVRKALTCAEGRHVTRDVGRGMEEAKFFSSYVQTTGGSERPTSFVQCGKPENRDVQCEIHSAKCALRIIGQLGLTYILCEDEDGSLVVIDQHAAHERLGFEALKKGYANKNIPGQRLLIPERIDLSPKEYGYISESMDAFEAAGFEVEPFGGTSIVVKTVPEILSGVALGGVFQELVGEMEDFGTAHSIEETVERIFSVVACHKQVRSGDRLQMEELGRLVRDVEREGVTHCPHGRPAIARFTENNIKKWFNRD